LSGDFVRRLIFLKVYGGNILEDILRKNRLYNHESPVSIRRLDNTQVIYLPVPVQIQIGKSAVRIVEESFEFLHVSCLPEQRCHQI